jgi:hypothetical protein
VILLVDQELQHLLTQRMFRGQHFVVGMSDNPRLEDGRQIYPCRQQSFQEHQRKGLTTGGHQVDVCPPCEHAEHVQHVQQEVLVRLGHAQDEVFVHGDLVVFRQGCVRCESGFSFRPQCREREAYP